MDYFLEKKSFIKEKGKCFYCWSREKLTLDHIQPISKGGDKFDKNNWQVLCLKCNRNKADKILILKPCSIKLKPRKQRPGKGFRLYK